VADARFYQLGITREARVIPGLCRVVVNECHSLFISLFITCVSELKQYYSHTVAVNTRSSFVVRMCDSKWRRSVMVSALASINVVNRHWAGYYLDVTVCGRLNHLGM